MIYLDTTCFMRMVVYNYVELWEYSIIYNCPERLRTEAPINKMLSSVLSSPFDFHRKSGHWYILAEGVECRRE
jgi:hypothetical protein